jgi:hypothetical protein
VAVAVAVKLRWWLSGMEVDWQSCGGRVAEWRWRWWWLGQCRWSGGGYDGGSGEAVSVLVEW